MPESRTILGRSASRGEGGRHQGRLGRKTLGMQDVPLLGRIGASDLAPVMCLRVVRLGFQVFNAVNDTITAEMPTEKFMAKYAPKTPVTRKIGEFEGSLSNRKIREVLGFKEQHDWRRYV